MRSIGLDLGKRVAEAAISEPGRGTRSAGRISAAVEGPEAFAATLGPDDQVVLEATTNTWAGRARWRAVVLPVRRTMIV